MPESDSVETRVASSEERFRVVLIVASIVAVLFAVPALLLAFQIIWLGAILLAVEGGIFAVFYRLAKRYWVGFLFVPPLFYVVLSTLLGLLAFMPFSTTITRIQ